MGRTAIIFGSGRLPELLRAKMPDALSVMFKGVDAGQPEGARLDARFEAIGAVFDNLRAARVTKIVFAGAMGRPALDPAAFDAKLMEIAPRILPAMAGGDDALLRAVIAVFEGEGFDVVGAHDIAPRLLAPTGVIAGTEPTDADLKDIARAGDILTALAPVDVGQGAVVAGGLCLGIETLQGTDALLRFAGATPGTLRRGAKGVLVKRPKAGQDLRVDMPTIGPATVEAAAAAGLAGIAVAAGATLVVDRADVAAAADAHGLFVWGT